MVVVWKGTKTGEGHWNRQMNMVVADAVVDSGEPSAIWASAANCYA